MLTMLVCATRWLFMHLYTLAHMSMHDSYLLVSHPCFNIMKLWTSDPNLHLSLVNTTFCLLFHSFAISLVCSYPCFSDCHAYHAYLLYAFSYALCIFFPFLVCWFHVFAFRSLAFPFGYVLF